ncbi:hypothetical protein Gpo141_00009308 [Globisporangium polare]
MDITVTSTVPCEITTANATSQSKDASLHAQQAVAHPSQRSIEVDTDTTTGTPEYKSVDLHDIERMAPVAMTRRSVSCFELGSAERRYRTIRIGEDSDELQQLAQANVTQLRQTASSSAEADANNALLARKALRFRKIRA